MNDTRTSEVIAACVADAEARHKAWIQRECTPASRSKRDKARAVSMAQFQSGRSQVFTGGRSYGAQITVSMRHVDPYGRLEGKEVISVYEPDPDGSYRFRYTR